MGRNAKNDADSAGVHRPSRPGRGQREPAETVRLRSPEDILARLPYIIGYHPAESVVAMAIDDAGNSGLAIRCDLPATAGGDGDPPPASGDPSGDPSGGQAPAWDHGGRAEGQAAYLAAVLWQRGAARTVVVLYSGSPVSCSALIGPLTAELAAAGIELADAIRAHGGRWWSLLCPDPECCPPEGRPYDLASNPITLQSVYRGEVALADEGEMRASVAPVTGPAREAMFEVAGQVTHEVGRRYAREAGAEAFREDGKAYVTARLDRYLAEARPPEDQEVAWTAVFICDLAVRDAAWLRMRRETARSHLAFWREIARRAVPPFDVGPTTLLAFAAWLSGDGALARCALERALATDPSYSMAYVVRDALAGMVPPSVWPPDLDDAERPEEAA